MNGLDMFSFGTKQSALQISRLKMIIQMAICKLLVCLCKRQNGVADR